MTGVQTCALPIYVTDGSVENYDFDWGQPLDTEPLDDALTDDERTEAQHTE